MIKTTKTKLTTAKEYWNKYNLIKDITLLDFITDARITPLKNQFQISAWTYGRNFMSYIDLSKQIENYKNTQFKIIDDIRNDAVKKAEDTAQFNKEAAYELAKNNAKNAEKSAKNADEKNAAYQTYQVELKKADAAYITTINNVQKEQERIWNISAKKIDDDYKSAINVCYESIHSIYKKIPYTMNSEILKIAFDYYASQIIFHEKENKDLHKAIKNLMESRYILCKNMHNEHNADVEIDLLTENDLSIIMNYL